MSADANAARRRFAILGAARRRHLSPAQGIVSHRHRRAGAGDSAGRLPHRRIERHHRPRPRASAGSGSAPPRCFVGRLALGHLARRDAAAGAIGGASWLDPAVRFGRRHARIAGGWSASSSRWRWPLPAVRLARHLSISRPRVLIYVMLGWGLNVVVGLAGLARSRLCRVLRGRRLFLRASSRSDLGLTFWEALPLSGLLAAARRRAARLSGAAAARRLSRHRHARLRRDHPYRAAELDVADRAAPTASATFRGPACSAWCSSARAPPGVTTFHEFFGIAFSPSQRIVFLYYVMLALALVTNLFTLRLRRLPIGRAWEALREDEIACRALGINPTNVKLSAFAIGAMLGGFAGAFFATRQGFISPESFTFTEIGHHPRHRRAGRHGQPDGRGAGGDRCWCCCPSSAATSPSSAC